MMGMTETVVPSNSKELKGFWDRMTLREAETCGRFARLAKMYRTGIVVEVGSDESPTNRAPTA
jgi:hypothetical protein